MYIGTFNTGFIESLFSITQFEALLINLAGREIRTGDLLLAR
jgi:hypothetical protein